MQQRYYDPAIGRFLSVDPAASEFNRYIYASDNPYRFTDPDGRMSMEEAKHKSEQARERRERHEANERAAHTGLTAGGSRDNVRTGPSPSQVEAQVRQGVGDGFASLVKGDAQAVRQMARGAGLLGSDEFQKAQKENDVIDEIGKTLATSPDAREATYQAVKFKIKNTDFSDPHLRGYVFGRVVIGMALFPAGALALVGDGYDLVERGVADPATLLIYTASGKDPAR